MPGPYEPVGAVVFVCPERVGGAVRARRWRAVRAPRFRRLRTGACPALTGSRGAHEASRVTLLLQVKSAASRRPGRYARGMAQYFQITAEPIPIDWAETGNHFLVLIHEELCKVVPGINGWQSGPVQPTADEPIGYWRLAVNGGAVTSELCAIPTKTRTVYLAIRHEADLTPEQISPWLTAISNALPRLHEADPLHEWWAVIMAGSSLTDGQVLNRVQDIAGMTLTPSGKPHTETVQSFLLPTLAGGQFRTGWPVVVHGATPGYSDGVAQEAAAIRVGRLCALLSVALDACWEIAEAPRSYRIDPDALPASRVTGDQVPADPRGNLVEIPEWASGALEVLDAEPDLLVALRAHHQALMLESQFPSFALLAYVAAIEGIGARYVQLSRCKECNSETGARRRFRAALGLVLAPEEIKPLVALYDLRSTTAHEGRLHGGEDLLGTFPAGRMASDFAPQLFRYGHVWTLRRASRELLTRGLTGSLPQPSDP
jgi:hypothetical protein